jgi:transposase InsO family protein
VSVLDGCSRFIVHWELRESMREADIEIVLQRAREEFPDAHPRIITDNGPQFIARDFHEFIRLVGMTHVRTSPYYRMARSNAGTAPSNAIACGPMFRSHSRRPGASLKASSRITTTCDFTLRSATSRRPTSWPAARRRSSPSGIASSKRHVNEGAKRGSLLPPGPMRYNTGRPGRRIGQRRGATRAPSQGLE